MVPKGEEAVFIMQLLLATLLLFSNCSSAGVGWGLGRFSWGEIQAHHPSTPGSLQWPQKRPGDHACPGSGWGGQG